MTFWRHSLPGMLAVVLLSLPLAGGQPDGMRQSLNGRWQFTIDPAQAQQANDATWDSITVPGNWDTLAKYSTHKGKGWYRRTFAVPAAWKGKHVRLAFDAVYHDATVTLNGKELGTHVGGYTPFEFDVTGLLNYGGENTVLVCADNTFRRGAWWHWGGISRNVSLIAGEDVRLVWQHIRSEPDLAAGTAQLFVRYKIANDGGESKTVAVKSSVEGIEFEKTVTVASHAMAECDATATMPKEQVRLWHFDHPNRYTLTTRLVCGGAVLCEQADRFGIRKIAVNPEGLWLNGEKVRLCGFNRVSDSREDGNTEPDALVKKDVDLMKRCGANLMRIMHYPQATNLLDYLDEKGILIWEEIPVWGESSDPNMKPDNPVTQQWLREMIDRDYNHPCIIGWSVGNELLKHYDYVKSMTDFTRKLDPHRLHTYVCFRGGRKDYGPADDPITVCDILLHNNYGAAPGKLAETLHGKWPHLPIFFSEFGSKQFGASADSTIPGLAERWADLAGHPYVIGVSLWTFNDYRSDYKGTPPSGNREWGVVDVNRRPKAAYEQVRKLYCPVRKLSAEGLTVRVEPRSPEEIPSYALRGYKVQWILRGSGGQTVREGALALPDLKPGDAAWTGRVEGETSGAAELVVRLVTPTGYDLCESRTALTKN